jgi:hypothetical protein
MYEISDALRDDILAFFKNYLQTHVDEDALDIYIKLQNAHFVDDPDW